MYLILIFFVLLLAVTFAWAGIRGAPWVPTWGKDVKRFLKLADIKRGERVYDLGCGDGRMVASASKAGGSAVGFEISLFPYFIAKIRGIFLKIKHDKRGRSSHSVAWCYKIKYKDFWGADLSDADVVYFFLMPKIYPKLKEKLEKELKKGTRVIAYVWPIEGWQAIKVDKHKRKPDIYLYIR
ncbi:MAG: hypothetical protein HQ539_00315 [Parcubacteria group bacterium]|nr:hypothetical protein [Parcubacteria group bacterium]